jgi:type I restriction enzyme S subunit
MSNYKIVKKGQFACNRMHVGRDYRIPISLSKEEIPFMVSPAYDVFEIIDTTILLPEYLMMWFSRKEFDRNTWFHTDADVRGGLPWSAFCDLELPLPTIEKQREIVSEYNTIQNRIALNNQLISKLEETAQAIYKQWFVDFEFPDKNGLPYKSNNGKMVWCEELEKEIPEGWIVSNIGKVLKNKGYIRGPFGSALKKDDMSPEGFPVYEQQHAIDKHRNFRYFVDSEKYNSLKRFSVEKNDFVISCSGTLGEVTVINENDPIGIINQALLILRVDPKILYPICFKYFITSKEGKSLLIADAAGSAQVNIAKREQISVIPIILPSIIEQSKVSEKLIHLDNLIFTKTKESQKLEELKDLLLAKMTRVEN